MTSMWPEGLLQGIPHDNRARPQTYTERLPPSAVVEAISRIALTPLGHEDGPLMGDASKKGLHEALNGPRSTFLRENGG